MRASLLVLLAACSDTTDPLPPVGPTCGNAILETGEACDEGDANGTGRCNSDCTVDGRCGDGVVNRLEECDEGVLDGLYSRCNLGCTLDGRCGDGVVNRVEQCDDGPLNSMAPGSCRPDCVRPACDDGVLDPEDACIGRMYWDGGFGSLVPIADRNGDGIDDFWFGSFRTNEYELWLSRHGRHERAWSQPWNATDWFEQDIDADGLVDLMAVYTSSAAIFLSAADGTLLEPHWMAVDIESRGHGVVADFDRDGTAEVVLVGREPGSPVSVFVFALRADRLERQSELPLPSQSGWSADAVDMDGDGDLNLLLYLDSGGNSTYFWTNVAGGLEPLYALPELDRLEYGAERVELDGIPPVDFIVYEDPDYHLFYNLRGQLEDGGTLEWGGFADFDGDGKAEHLVATADGLDIRSLPSDAPLIHVPTSTTPSAFVWPAGLDWDQNGDGVLDLVVYERPGTAEVFVRQGDFLLPPVPWSFDTFVDPAFGVKADGDDLPDLCAFGLGAIQRGRDQDLIRVSALEAPLVRLEPVAREDTDSLDVYGLDDRHTLIRVPGTGDGFGPASAVLPGVDAFAMGDFDADPWVDAAVATPGIGIAHGLPGGSLAAPVATATVADPVLELVAADVTGDGALDVAYRTARSIGVVTGEPLIARPTFPVSEGASMAAADIDRDGRSDLVVRDAMKLQIFLGSPSGLVHAFDVPSAGRWELVLADVTRDGVLDAITMGDALYVAPGELASGYHLGPESQVTLNVGLDAIAAGDLTGDGETDLVARGIFGAGEVLVNTPGGLSSRRVFGFHGQSFAHALGDVNGDGVLDLLTIDGADAVPQFNFFPSELVAYLAHP